MRPMFSSMSPMQTTSAWRSFAKRRKRSSAWSVPYPGTPRFGTSQPGCAVSTSGLSNKLVGRVGDSPIIGAGNYCDNDVGAACATGIGELAIKNAASFAIVERMRAGLDPKRACDEILARVVAHHPEVKTDENAQLAFIAMNKRGEVGGAALRKQTKVFRYALFRGTKNAPALVDVKPQLG